MFDLSLGSAWAGNTVNMVIFRHHGIFTVGRLQFSAFYADRSTLRLVQRDLDTNSISTFDLRGTYNVDDAHNSISLGWDRTGILHLAYDHHSSALRYRRSTSPLSVAAWTDELPMTGRYEQHVTYPCFISIPDQKPLLFLYRDGSSKNGAIRLKEWSEDAGQWQDRDSAIASGAQQRPWTSNPYWNHPAIGPDGSIHLSFVWRTLPIGTEQRVNNVNIDYARSPDLGRTWYSSLNRRIDLPITQVNSETVRAVSPGSNLINQTAMALDGRGNPHIVFYADDPDSVPQYQHLWFDGRTWNHSYLTNRRTAFALIGRSTLQLPISRPEIVIDRHNRAYVIYRGDLTGNRLVAQRLLPPDYRPDSSDQIVLWDHPLGNSEPIIDRVRWQQDGVLTVLVQKTVQPDSDKDQILPTLEEVFLIDRNLSRLWEKRRVREGEDRPTSLARRILSLEAQLSAVYVSRSWRITAPLRAIWRGARWLLWNLRRAWTLASWLGTGQFRRAGDALLAWYDRHLPPRVKAMIPAPIRQAAKRSLRPYGIRPTIAATHRTSALAGKSSRVLKSAIAAADEALIAKDWPAVVTRWQALLEDCGESEELAGRARLNISVARRLSGLDEFREQVARYANSRVTGSSQPQASVRMAIYTAISGGYDSIKLPETIDPRFDYILFTDTPTAETGVWQVRPITSFQGDEARTARFVKTHPHLLLPDYAVVVWIDSSFMILGDTHPLVAAFVDSGKAVAAAPHTHRTSVYEEADACARYRKDDLEIMRTQVSRYRGLGFVHDDLIESGLMMFNLQDPRTRLFLDGWWTEIERYSKRDQLSVNFALKQAGIEWHRLIEPPSSIRNHPLFAFVPHGDDGPSSQLIDALCLPVSDPYSGPSFADVRMQRIAAQRNRRIDVVVCVHNALNDVRQCLDSILRARVSEQQRLIIIDDGSDDPTARYLEEFARAVAWAELHRNDQASGYTRSANQGLARSSGELVILLNSDTIVTDAWAEKLADAVFSTSGAGIVGPVSNAASHQSIPENRGSASQTAINKLPLGVTAEDLNRCCERWTVADVLPRVPLVHGFCFGITRAAIERIGMFDEANYPRGYGEENDYCFRATDAGFGLVVATHTFVYHAKSKSFNSPERMSLRKAGSQTLTRTHGRARVARAVRSMEENPMLVRLRRRAHQLQSVPS